MGKISVKKTEKIFRRLF